MALEAVFVGLRLGRASSFEMLGLDADRTRGPPVDRTRRGVGTDACVQSRDEPVGERIVIRVPLWNCKKPHSRALCVFLAARAQSCKKGVTAGQS